MGRRVSESEKSDGTKEGWSWQEVGVAVVMNALDRKDTWWWDEDDKERHREWFEVGTTCTVQGDR